MLSTKAITWMKLLLSEFAPAHPIPKTPLHFCDTAWIYDKKLSVSDKVTESLSLYKLLKAADDPLCHQAEAEFIGMQKIRSIGLRDMGNAGFFQHIAIGQ